MFIGAAQILALFPGISRSGATMAAGLWRGQLARRVRSPAWPIGVAGTLNASSSPTAIAAAIMDQALPHK